MSFLFYFPKEQLAELKPNAIGTVGPPGKYKLVMKS